MRALNLVTLAALALTLGCEAPPPTRLEISPSGKVKMSSKSDKEVLKVMAYDKKTRPWIGELKPVWKSSDEAVVTVSEAGEVKAAGSGTATITATTHNLEASVDAEVVIVGSVEIAKDTKKKLKMLKQDIVLKVTVKDDKGNVIEKPRLTFTANDYCVDVNAEGKVHPQATGKCSVTVNSRGVTDMITFQVY